MMSDPGILRTVIFGAVITFVFGLGFFGLFAALLAKIGLRRMSARERRAAIIFGTLSVIGVGCFLYGWLIEADWLSVTQIEMTTSKLPPGSRVRIVHLTDLHVNGPSRTMSVLADRVNELQPDLLVFTGDAIANRESLDLFRDTLTAIKTKYGRFAVRGNHDVWYFAESDLFGRGVAQELTGTATSAGGLILCGAAYDDPGALKQCLAANSSSFRVAIYHTPDLVEDITSDLYLAGHTHGGQIRMPFYGALVTLSKFDKKYEMGRYSVGETTLFVSRGIGFEPPPAPRVRFLCRPEIAVIDVRGVAKQDRGTHD